MKVLNQFYHYLVGLSCDKLLHGIIAYLITTCLFVICYLITNSLFYSSVVSASITFIIGIFKEVYDCFSDGHSPEVDDIIADLVGILISIIIYLIIYISVR